MAKETKELQQTRGTFKLSGKVKRIDAEKAYNQDEGKSGKKKGVPYRSLNFIVQTSENNEVRVEAFAYKPDEVFLWNSELAKKEKEKGGKYKGKRVSYYHWKENEEQLREDGFATLESRVGLSYDEDGKLNTESLPLYVAIDKIFKSLENGDDVHIEGEVRHSSYENNQGKQVKKVQCALKRVFRSAKPIEFDAEDFEERAYFEDEIVYVDSEKHPTTKGKFVVIGRTIDFRQEYQDNEYVIDATEDASMSKFAGNIKKRFKFGDKVTVFGKIVNRVEVAEVEETEDDFLASLGGKAKPAHAQQFGVRNYVQELSVEGVEDYMAKFYSEEDFANAGFIEDKTSNNSINDELGGKSKSKVDEDDPFADSGLDVSEDELPF